MGVKKDRLEAKLWLKDFLSRLIEKLDIPEMIAIVCGAILIKQTIDTTEDLLNSFTKRIAAVRGFNAPPWVHTKAMAEALEAATGIKPFDWGSSNLETTEWMVSYLVSFYITRRGGDVASISQAIIISLVKAFI